MRLSTAFLGCLSLVIPCSLAALLQPHHSQLTQDASVGCSLGTAQSTSYLTFFLVKNSDTVDAIYLVNDTDYTDTSYTTYSTNSGNITGTGIAGDPYTFTVPVSGILPSALTIPSDYPYGYLKDATTVAFKVMVKSFYNALFQDQVIFPDDVMYTVYCNFSDVSDTEVFSGSLNVTGYVGESPTPLVEVAVLNVKDNTTDGVLTDATIGQTVYLEAMAQTPTLTTGTYVHSCNLCDTSTCNGNVVVQIIDKNGCSRVQYISKFTGQGVTAVTVPFNAFVLANSNKIYFRCYVNFCYDQNQQECIDYCSLATVGRKRRDVSTVPREPDQEISASLLVTVGGDVIYEGDNGPTVDVVDNNVLFPSDVLNERAEAREQQEKENTVLLSSVIALSALIVVGLIAATCIFYRLTKRNKNVQ